MTGAVTTVRASAEVPGQSPLTLQEICTHNTGHNIDAIELSSCCSSSGYCALCTCDCVTAWCPSAHSDPSMYLEETACVDGLLGMKCVLRVGCVICVVSA